MSSIANCRHCSKTFEQKRSDHLFCSAKCVAAYYRAVPNPDMIHAEKEHINRHYCEQCGLPYDINDYAERGGKRTPKYCSPKCKQAAYRERQKEAQPQAERRYSQRERAQSDTWRNNRQQQNTQHEQPARDPYARMSKHEKAYMILGVKEPFTKTELRKAYHAAMKKVHPDVYKGQDATQRAQEVNWAYEFLK